MIFNEEDVLKIIEEDTWMMDILRAASTLELPDWWVCAGFVRSKIWDTLHGFKERTAIPDVDVVYYDRRNLDESVEKEHEAKLRSILPDVPWSVKNEARMHLINNIAPYESSEDAISKFPETVTSLGLKLDERDSLILTAPHGLQDVINMEVSPTPQALSSEEMYALYRERVQKKNWPSVWSKVKVFY